MATKARFTAEDLWRMPDSDNRRELVNGEVLEMPPAGALHGELVATVCHLLKSFVEHNGGGKVVAGDVGFILNLPSDHDRVRAPDVAFISGERLPDGKLTRRFFKGSPDLAIEVLSPYETSLAVQQKVRDYLEAGARLVWVIAPEADSVTVHRRDGTASLVREGEALDGENVLPGLSIPLVQLFQ